MHLVIRVSIGSLVWVSYRVSSLYTNAEPSSFEKLNNEGICFLGRFQSSVKLKNPRIKMKKYISAVKSPVDAVFISSSFFYKNMSFSELKVNCRFLVSSFHFVKLVVTVKIR